MEAPSASAVGPSTAAAVGDQNSDLLTAPNKSPRGEQVPGRSSPDSVNHRCPSKRRRQHLAALALGVLEVVFTVRNAIREKSFQIEDEADFVFFSSMVMESLGLAFTLLCAIGSLGKKWGGVVGTAEPLEEFGAPLAILTNGVMEQNLALQNVGVLGAMIQAISVFVVALIFLSGTTAFIVVACVGASVPCCYVCCSLGSCVTNHDIDEGYEDGYFDHSSSPTPPPDVRPPWRDDICVP